MLFIFKEKLTGKKCSIVKIYNPGSSTFDLLFDQNDDQVTSFFINASAPHVPVPNAANP